ncbi:hypothetical protein FISHEDRAFT_31127, partial [Fistulina hepatica ATCC 64428]
APRSIAQSPIKRLALHSTSTCAAQAAIYGKCIVKSYTDVRKGMCQAEWDNFSSCMREAV